MKNKCELVFSLISILYVIQDPIAKELSFPSSEKGLLPPFSIAKLPHKGRPRGHHLVILEPVKLTVHNNYHIFIASITFDMLKQPFFCGIKPTEL